MQKKRKSIFTAVITALFVLSVGYFAMLAPTTAWYYEETAIGYNYTFNFRNLDESFTQQIGSLSVPLRAATRFADGGEWLFDEVIHVVEVTTTNQSSTGLDGIVHVSVTNLPTGVRWYAFGSDTRLSTTRSSTLTGGNKGTYKPLIEAMLADFCVDVQLFSGESGYTTYNTKAIAALNANNAEGVLVPADTVAANATKYIYIVFWAEYGDVSSTLKSTSVTTPINGTATVTVTAKPYLGSYSTQNKTLTLTNTTGSAVTVSVQVAGESSARTVSFSGNGTQTETIPSESQVRITASGHTLAIVSGGGRLAGYTSDGNGGYIQNSVCSVPDMTSNLSLSIS